MASHERYRLFFLEGSLLLILLIGCVSSKNQQQSHTCGKGLSTPGYTFPSGDITLEYGDSLDILCVLHENNSANYGANPSSYMYIKFMEEIQPTDVVNSTAIRLHIENHPKTKNAIYACMYNDTFVCHNVVIVGTKPQPVTDFKCISHNYENLTCDWTASENYVKTEYYLEYIPSARPVRFASKCPNITYKDETKLNPSCTWTFATRPPYRHSHKHYTFTLYANNTFGNTMWEFGFEHYPHVVPNAPENLTANATSPHSIKLKWLIPVPMQGFPGDLEHRVMWWIKGNKHWVTLPTIKMERTEFVKYELTSLPFAHCLYDIRVSMKSLSATDESLWSQNSSITVWTKPKLPDRPPRTDIGSFEIQPFGNRIIYWQNIHDYEENGQDFSYTIKVEGHPDIKPKKSNSNYAKFENFTDDSYTFKIWSKNELGSSAQYSTVFVPSPSEALKPPSKLIKVDREHGVYDLEWVINDDPRVTNYTLFWCADPKDRPYQCDGTLNWTVVEQGKKSVTLKLDEFNEETNRPNNYQFAISANGYRISSGMLWAECTVIPGRGIKLSQTYVKNVGSRFITVVWKLECVKMGDIQGFNITYCPLVHSPQSTECKNNSLQYTLINGPGAEEGVIGGLMPYTRYKIRVKPLLNDAESQFSEPMFNLTLEDLPTAPRNLRIVNKSVSSMLIQWEKPAEENGIITHYQVSLNGESKKVIYPEKDKVVYEENLTNLTARTEYTIEVKACVKDCSKATIKNETEIGLPGRVGKPYANFDNYSLVVRWGKPDPVKVDYYEVFVEANRDKATFNVSGLNYLVTICEKDKSQNQNVNVKVRAVNVFAGRLLPGPWSDQANFPCSRSDPSETWVIISIIIFTIVFLMLICYLVKRLWDHVKYMRKIPVILPDGLRAAVETFEKKEKPVDDTQPADEPLLSKKSPNQTRNPSGESSGCCSGTESVSSSVESAGHLSMSDSGTEQPPRSPSLGDHDGNGALRQRVTKPIVKKSDYVTMPEMVQASWSSKPTQGGYSVIGLITPPKKPDNEPEYMVLSDIPAKTSYVPCPVPQTQEHIKEPTIRPPSSGYVPYMEQEPAAKNTEYVLAGVPTKPSLVLTKVPLFTQSEETSSGYVKAPPMPMEAPKLPWQQQAPIEPPSLGYVVVGDSKLQKGPLDMQKGSKGYVPHHHKFDTTKSLKED